MPIAYGASNAALSWAGQACTIGRFKLVKSVSHGVDESISKP